MLQPILENLCKNRVVLASQSPRRKEIMEMMGFKKFDILPSNFEENLDPKVFASLADFVEETAYQKVMDIHSTLIKTDEKQPSLIVGADTIVTLDGEIFGKPKDKQDAFSTLSRLSGRTNVVYTSVVLKFPRSVYKFTESTKVTFGKITPERINEYIATGEPMDKAGSYGIQGYASTLIEKIDGDLYTVVGLPIFRTVEALLNHHYKEANDSSNID